MSHLRKLVVLLLPLVFAFAPLAARGQKVAGKMMASAPPPVLTVTYSVDAPPPYTPGETLNVRFTVANPGATTAENISLQPTANNVVFRPLEGPCKGQPCTIPYLRQGQQAVFVLTCLVAQGGAFNATLTASVGANAPKTFSATFSATTASPATAGQPNPTKSPAPDQPANAQKIPPAAPDNLQPVAPAEANTGKAVISVQASLMAAKRYQPGQAIGLLLKVTNRGTRTAPRVVISSTAQNLTLNTADVACSLVPCIFTDIAPGATRSLKIGAVIVAAGDFGYTAHVLSPVTDKADATSRAGGSTLAVTPPPPPSDLVWLGGALAIVAVVVLSRAFWPTQTSVTAELDPAACVSAVGPLTFPQPAVHVQASLTLASPPEPVEVPILRQEITHD